MNIFQRIARLLTRQTTLEELNAELHIRGSRRDDRVAIAMRKKKTRRGAAHKHKAPGEGLHCRSYLPGGGPFGQGRASRA